MSFHSISAGNFVSGTGCQTTMPNTSVAGPSMAGTSCQSTTTATGAAGASTPGTSLQATETKMNYSNMTFGVEMEFLVLWPYNCFDSLALDGSGTITKTLDHLLTAQGIPASSCYTPNLARLPRYSRWHISMDCHRLTEAEGAQMPKGYNVSPVEIASRKLSFSDGNWQQELPDVLAVVQSLKSFGCVMLTNQNCGLHVHMGFGDEYVPIETCKNLYLVSTAMERCIDQLHSSSRITPGEGVRLDSSRHFNAPISWFFEHTVHRTGSDAKPSVFDWLQSIEACDSYSEICDTMSVNWDGSRGARYIGGHNSVLNFENCDSYGDDIPATGTVEFRQKEGTLDHAEICAWVWFTAQLTIFCDSASAKEIVSLCGNAWNHDFTVFHLMETIGCSDNLIQHFYQSRLPSSYSASKEQVAKDAASLAAGEFTGLDAVMFQNSIDNFHRHEPLSVSVVSSRKLFSELQGRYMRFSPAVLAGAERVFDQAAQEAAAGKGDLSSAKIQAFKAMNT